MEADPQPIFPLRIRIYWRLFAVYFSGISDPSLLLFRMARLFHRHSTTPSLPSLHHSPSAHFFFFAGRAGSTILFDSAASNLPPKARTRSTVAA